MISNKDLQRGYINLYKQLRNYIWDFKTVVKIAALETATHQTCPDLEEIRREFRLLRQEVSEVANEDEEFNAELESFEDLIESSDTTYSKLKIVEEVIPNENF